MGRVEQVSISRGGVPKRAVSAARFTTYGVEGDSHAHPQYHGGPRQAVLLIADEALEILKGAGYPVYRGALGENLTCSGLHPSQWRAGQRYRAGGALIELTTVREPCRTIQIYGPQIGKAIYDARVKHGDAASPVWGLSGFYAAVVGEGEVHPGDSLELVSEVA